MMIKDYPYLYETHLHTRPGSACANYRGAEMAEAALKKGYAGIIVTDHNWGGNTGVDRNLPWDQWVERFIIGYLEAKEFGEKHDFDVFWGYEAGGYQGTEFLVYGITPEWLLEHPQIRSADIREHYRLVHEAGGMMIHAHPFREAPTISGIRLYPDCVDGVEAINAVHSSSRSKGYYNPDYDKRAIAYAREHGLPLTAGSDIHTTDLLGGGMAFKRRLTSCSDYCSAVLGGEDYVLTNGDSVFDKSGKYLYDLRPGLQRLWDEV